MDFAHIRGTGPCLSSISISSTEPRQQMSSVDRHPMSACDCLGSFSGYIQPVPPPGEFNNESGSISADELRYEKSITSDASTEVLGDRLSPIDSEVLDEERALRMDILDQIEPYCRKVFVGSVPSGVDSRYLLDFFSYFGPVTVDYRAPYRTERASYAFLNYHDAKSVNRLLDACITGNDATHIINLPCVGIYDTVKPVVIRAWRTADRVWRNSLIKGPQNSRYSVFVGGVPRVCTAAALAQVFEREFGDVTRVIIEVEQDTGFPKGIARVVFLSKASYRRAIKKHKVTLFTLKPLKDVEVKPFLESKHPCEFCLANSTAVFCGGPECLQYICHECWEPHRQRNPVMPHYILCRYDEENRAALHSVPAQLGFQGVTPSGSHMPRIHEESDYGAANVSSSMSGYDRNTSLLSHGDHVPKRSNPITFHSEHGRGSMMSLPNRRTPITEIVPEEQQMDYSRRVFIGSLPHGATQDGLTIYFTSFGRVDVEMPSPNAGHAFLNFSSVSAVRAMVSRCRLLNDRLILDIYLDNTPASHASTSFLPDCIIIRRRSLPINYDLNPTSACYSVFIGGVPRSSTAADLAQVVQSHFGDVALLMIDVDPFYEYPKGSARAVFLTKDVYVRAIQKRFLMVYNRDHPKQVEIKPFVDVDMPCDICGKGLNRSFCPEIDCLKYYCLECWRQCHVFLPHHSPLRTRSTEAIWVRLEKSNKQRGDKLVRSAPRNRPAVDFQLNPNGRGTIYDYPMQINSLSNVPLFLPFDAPTEFGAPPKDFGPIGSGRRHQ